MKILIIRFSSIGDIVLTTPVIRGLKKQLKKSEIHFITKSAYTSILENNPYIDKVYSFTNSLSEIIPHLKKENYDYIIDLHKNIRSLSLRWKLKTKSFSFNKLNFQKWLLVNFKINKLPDIHIVDRYLKATESLGVKNDGLGLDYFIPKNAEIEGKKIIEKIKKDYLVIVLGGKFFTKKLSVEKIINIGQKVNRAIVILGGKDEIEEAKRIEKKLAVTNLCGTIDLNTSAFIVKNATKILTNDTGLMHIAATFNKEIISVWGNTIPEFGMFPYFNKDTPKTNSHIIEVKNLKCRPCSKLGYKKKCPEGHFKCINKIDEKKILQIINQ
ncbi:MAG: glycosyltransferase family 9 protein [Bacteroidota bacterium]|nr:glycosyltransferase family 9 protein [Bacteroidota bacterium]